MYFFKIEKKYKKRIDFDKDKTTISENLLLSIQEKDKKRNERPSAVMSSADKLSRENSF